MVAHDHRQIVHKSCTRSAGGSPKGGLEAVAGRRDSVTRTWPTTTHHEAVAESIGGTRSRPPAHFRRAPECPHGLTAGHRTARDCRGESRCVHGTHGLSRRSKPGSEPWPRWCPSWLAGIAYGSRRGSYPAGAGTRLPLAECPRSRPRHVRPGRLRVSPYHPAGFRRSQSH